MNAPIPTGAHKQLVRRCSVCGVSKQLTEHNFSPRGEIDRKDEFISACKPCRKAQKDEVRARVAAVELEPKYIGPMRQCQGCREMKPLTKGYFQERCYKTGTKRFRHICHKCRNAGITRDPEAERISQQKPSKTCNTCCGLSWRVAGIKCRECGMRREAEPAVEIPTRKYSDPRSGW
jgi:hypothetical protein